MYNAILPLGASLVTSFSRGSGPIGPAAASSFDKAAFADRFKPSDRTAPEPDWSKTRTKTEPAMSDDEYEKAIIESAKKDAVNGVRRFSSKESSSLMESYTSVASPDRKAIYQESMNQTGGKLNMTHAFFTGQGERVMHYNTNENQWMNVMTKAEVSRRQQFVEIYNKAYISTYEDIQNGKSAQNSQSGFNTKA